MAFTALFSVEEYKNRRVDRKLNFCLKLGSRIRKMIPVIFLIVLVAGMDIKKTVRMCDAVLKTLVGETAKIDRALATQNVQFMVS